MPRGREPEGQTALSTAERQARYRARRQAAQPPSAVKPSRPARQSRAKRWNDAVAEMLAVQAECAAWFEALPENLHDSATAAALQEMIDLDLDATPPFSRRLAMAVTEKRASTVWPRLAPGAGGGKSRVLAMLAAKRRLRVAPVPPRAADLTPPPPGAVRMPGRDEGTGTALESRNNDQRRSSSKLEFPVDFSLDVPIV